MFCFDLSRDLNVCWSVACADVLTCRKSLCGQLLGRERDDTANGAPNYILALAPKVCATQGIAFYIRQEDIFI
jgi:hypothetical protein